MKELCALFAFIMLLFFCFFFVFSFYYFYLLLKIYAPCLMTILQSLYVIYIHIYISTHISLYNGQTKTDLFSTAYQAYLLCYEYLKISTLFALIALIDNMRNAGLILNLTRGIPCKYMCVCVFMFHFSKFMLIKLYKLLLHLWKDAYSNDESVLLRAKS